MKKGEFAKERFLYSSSPIRNNSSYFTQYHMAVDSTTVQTPLVFNLSETLHVPFVVYTTLNSGLSVTALLGNAFIFDALRKSTTLQPPSKALFFSLVVSDLGVGLVAQPLFVCYLLAVITNSLELFRITKYAYNLIGDLLGAVSLLTMMAISIDRLLALLLRFTYRRNVTVKRVCAVIVIFWVLSSLLAGFYFWDFSIYVIISFVGLSVCLAITFAAYFKICFSLRRFNGQVHHHTAMPQREIKRNAMTLRTLKRYKLTVATARYIFGALLACFLPRVVALIVWHVQGKSAPVVALYYFTSTLVFFNSSVNPVLYYCRIREVRQLTRQRLKELSLSICHLS